jgi:uncharacterized protein YjeT (DUF2065 family)
MEKDYWKKKAEKLQKEKDGDEQARGIFGLVLAVVGLCLIYMV